MEASDIVGVGAQLAVRYLAVASPKKEPVEGAPAHVAVPPAVVASWNRFAVSHDALSTASALRIATPAPTPTDAPDAANTASDVPGSEALAAWLLAPLHAMVAEFAAAHERNTNRAKLFVAHAVAVGDREDAIAHEVTDPESAPSRGHRVAQRSPDVSTARRSASPSASRTESPRRCRAP